jgi:hypothetical protein
MSSRMPSPPPPKPPMGGGDPIGQNQSLMNPADLAAMKQTGDVTPNMTVRDLLQKMGIDVDGPVSQLQEFAKKQVQGATGLGKMNSIAGMPGGQGAPPPTPGPGPGGPPPGGPSPPGGMASLLKNMR